MYTLHGVIRFLDGLISTLSPLNNTFEYSSGIGMTHPFGLLKRCLTSYIAGFMVLSRSALNPCTCLIFSRIHCKKALENYHQSSIDQSASGRGRWYQEPITRSLHTKCNLESTLSRMFLFLELRYVWGGGGL